MSEINSPSGYKQLPADGSFNDAIQPLFFKLTDQGLQFTLQVCAHHVNPMGICHGAVYMTLMDIALSATICHALGKYTGTPTINISLDYMTPAKIGDWLVAEVEPLKLTRTVGFAQGLVRSDKGIHVRASGTFRLPDDIDSAPGILVEDLPAHI